MSTAHVVGFSSIRLVEDLSHNNASLESAFVEIAFVWLERHDLDFRAGKARGLSGYFYHLMSSCSSSLRAGVKITD
eukprot:scaffold299663_cov22-Prasinocladus_malaysianus.AAC.1